MPLNLEKPQNLSEVLYISPSTDYLKTYEIVHELINYNKNLNVIDEIYKAGRKLSNRDIHFIVNYKVIGNVRKQEQANKISK